MKALLVTFFNSSNMGDLLIAETLKTIVAQKGIEFDSLDYSTGKEPRENNETEIEFQNSSNLAQVGRIKNGILKLLRRIDSSLVWSFYHRNFKKYDTTQFEKNIIGKDVLIIGGGNMIYDIGNDTLSSEKFNRYVNIAKKHNVKIFAISLGIGPFKTKFQEWSTIETLSKCDFISFRDQKSYNYMNKELSSATKKIEIAPDPVFTLPNMRDCSLTENVIAVNIINYSVFRENTKLNQIVVNNYVRLIETIIEDTNLSIKLFSTEKDDYSTINDVYSRIKSKYLKKVKIKEINNFKDLMSLYNQSQLLIGTRMHSLIIAYTQYLPVIGLSWQQKVTAMFKLIDEENNCYDILKLENDLDTISKKVISEINNFSKKKRTDKLDEIRRNIKINETIIDEIRDEI